MNIGIDYDGTIANANIVKTRWIKELFGLDISPWKMYKTSCVLELARHMPREEAVRIYDAFPEFIYTGGFGRNTPEVPGASRSVLKLSQRHKLHLVTARPQEMLTDSIAWLKAKSIYRCFRGVHSSQIVDPRLHRLLTKAEICEAYGLQLLIDDEGRHLRYVQVPHLERILIKNGVPKECIDEPDTSIHLANSWDDVLDIINEIQFSDKMSRG